jgi:hypothetical protein
MSPLDYMKSLLGCVRRLQTLPDMSDEPAPQAHTPSKPRSREHLDAMVKQAAAPPPVETEREMLKKQLSAHRGSFFIWSVYISASSICFWPSFYLSDSM